MARYTWKSGSVNAYDFNRKCKVQNINQSETTARMMEYMFEKFGVDEVLRAFGVADNVRKTPDRDAKGKIKKVDKLVVPTEVTEADEVLEALNWKSNELKFKFRKADSANYAGSDYYKSVLDIRLDGDKIVFKPRAGLADTERTLEQAKNYLTDAFMMPITRSGVVTSIRYFTKKENRTKMFKTVERLGEIKNFTRERWMSKYSILKTDTVIEGLTNPAEKSLALELQVLLYVKFKNTLEKLAKEGRFDPARLRELENRRDKMKVKYSKPSASNYESWFYNCIVHIESLGFKQIRKNKKGRR